MLEAKNDEIEADSGSEGEEEVKGEAKDIIGK